MRLEWLDDLLAVIDHRTLTQAAEARLVAQPAFSRRFRAIEEHLGVDLIDRTNRPARLKPSLLLQERRLRELATGLRQLVRELRRDDAELRSRVVIAAQHAIATSLAPHILRRFESTDVSFRLRSANREECYALIMTRQADLMLCYQTAGDRFESDNLLERLDLGVERLVPVFARDELPRLQAAVARGKVPIVLYPAEVFFGRRMEQEIVPNLPSALVPVRRAETALTLAALQLAEAGVGVAWVPLSLAVRSIGMGSLADLSDWLPSSGLDVTALRLVTTGVRPDAEESVWHSLVVPDLPLRPAR